MPDAPSVPTDFAIANRARPFAKTPGITGGIGEAPFDGVLLTWTLNGGSWVRLQISKNGADWKDVSAAGPLAGYYGINTFVRLTEAQVVGIQNFGTAHFRLRAESTAGFSPWTATIQFPTSNTNPYWPTAASLTAPTGLALNSNTLESVSFSWIDPNTQEDHYEIEFRRATTGALTTWVLLPFETSIAKSVIAGGLLYSTTYTAHVRAAAVTGVAPGSVTLVYAYSDWSDEVYFTTADGPGSNSIKLLGLPATVNAWAGSYFSYMVQTDSLADSIVATGLPEGLAMTGALIHGILTGLAGTMAVSITATKGTGTDTKLLTIEVEPITISLLFAKDESEKYLDVTAANAADLGKGRIGSELRIHVRSSAIGPALPINTVTLAGAPAWLAVSGLDLAGTPTAAGDWNVIVTGSNGTEHDAEVLHIYVLAVEIYSAAEAWGIVASKFSFTITVAPDTGPTISMTGAPNWLTLDGRTLSGVPDVAGDIRVILTATFGSATFVQNFTIHVASVIAIGDGSSNVVSGWMGDQLLERLGYNGTCEAEHWYLSGGPPGVEIGALMCAGYSASSNVVAIAGVSSAAGIYDGQVTVQTCCGGVPQLFSVPIRFEISGGLFLAWFHNDPFRRELQVMARSYEVQGYYLQNGTLWLTRGDNAKIYVIFRDGPIADNNLGRNTISDGFADLELTIRPVNDYDGEPYIQVGGAPVTEVIDGITVFLFTFDVTGDAIERDFNELNMPAGAEANSAALMGVGEIRWSRHDRTQTSRTVDIAISQDNSR